jgi:hypothetical protein
MLSVVPPEALGARLLSLGVRGGVAAGAVAGGG